MHMIQSANGNEGYYTLARENDFLLADTFTTTHPSDISVSN